MVSEAPPSIRERQNRPDVVRYMAAAARRYRTAKAIRFVRSLGVVALAAVAPLMVAIWPDTAITLGAIGGAAIVASRLLFASWESATNDEGVRMQERFDCEVFGLGWNSALGRPPREESVAAAAGANKRSHDALDWYPDVGLTPYPRDVMICQRSSAAWGHRLHREYGRVLLGVATAWMAIGAVVSIVADVDLATWLVGVLLPSLPAILDAIDLWRGHEDASIARSDLTEAIEDHLSQSAADTSSCRATQDRLFELRQREPKVSEIYYRLRRARMDADMRDAAMRWATPPAT